MVICLEIKGEEELKLGDLIQLPRLKGLYSHWAVYVGESLKYVITYKYRLVFILLANLNWRRTAHLVIENKTI
jgi:hypothetical protein